MSGPPGAIAFRFGVFELDFRARELRRQGRTVRLQDKPFELLVALAERPNTIVTREELRRRLWPADTHVVFDANLNTAVRKVREALGDDAETPRFVETVPRRGYRFVAPVVVMPEPDAAPPPPLDVAPDRFRRRMRTGTAVIVVAGLTMLLLLWPRQALSPATASSVRFTLAPPEDTMFPNGGTAPLATVSPDGQLLAFLAESRQDNVTSLWLQSLSSGEATRLPGTEHGWSPFWSPDGRELGFVSDGHLKILDVEAPSQSRILTDAPVDNGASWGRRGDILVGVAAGHLERISSAGGPRQAVTAVDRSIGERRHLWPQFLPDGRTFIYLAEHETPANSVVMLGSLDSIRPIPLVSTRAGALFDSREHLLYLSDDGTLLARRLDVALRRLTGKPIIVATGVAQNRANGRARFSVSASGVLVYSGQVRAGLLQLSWMDRRGAMLGTVGEPGPYQRYDLSPDGRRLAAERANDVAHAPDIWLIDLERGEARQVIAGPAADDTPVWAPDGRRFAYGRHDAAMEPAQIAEHEVGTGRDDRILTRVPGSHHPTDWVGHTILYQTLGQGRDLDVWMHRLDERKSTPLVTTDADEQQGRLSADGRWFAYTSNETGRYEVYVARIDAPRERWQISREGGAQPRWRGDDREIVFVSEDRHLMSVALAPTAAHPHASPPRRLADVRWLRADQHLTMPFAMTRDAQRFLVGPVVRDFANAPVTVITNWAVAPRVGTR